MTEMMNDWIGKVSGFLYDPWVPLFLVVAGVVLTIWTGFPQIRMLKESFRVVMEKPATEGAMSSFGALMISTASRVGTGNIVGVSTAICLGGVGAVFWMWFIAIFGGASAYVESTLAQIYKRKNPDGSGYGGPSYYMETALRQRWLGVVFSVFVILTYALGYNAVASYNLQSTFAGFGFYNAETTPAMMGIALAILFLICIMGGGRRLARVTGVMVPVMGVIYILVALIIVVLNLGKMPSVFGAIFSKIGRAHV